MLYAIPALVGAHAAAVGDPDIWWHLRTGEWILQHRCVPHTDPFSAFGFGKPWAAYSWLFEVLLFHLYRALGVVGIVLYTAGLLLAIAAAMHRLVSHGQRDFSTAVLLTFAACLSFGHLYTPRPWLFTILFFIVEIDILMQARRTGRVRMLAWLPILFATWANIHIQFVDGLMVLALACAESIFAHWRLGTPTRIRPAALVAVTLASILGTLCNPYGWHIYQVAHDLAAQPGVLYKLQELQAIPFRDIYDWSVLALALAATAALASYRRFLPFETALLGFALFLAFRSQRDVWLLATVSAAILAFRTSIPRESPHLLAASSTPIVLALATVAIFLGFHGMSIDNDHLKARLSATLPVNAVKFIQVQHYSGPVYNDYGWGGYLMWQLRMPVSIDGRAAFYGDRRINLSDATWSGQPDWASDPDLRSSRLVIGPTKAPLTQILRLDPDFHLAYEDQLATVFVRGKP